MHRANALAVMRNLYLHNNEYPKATGPYDIIKGRSLSWQSSTGSKHYLYLNRTVVTDQGMYYCTFSEEDTYLDTMTAGLMLHVNGKLSITDM